jgi:hypothetical protein
VRRIRQHERARFFISSDGGVERGTGPAWIRVSPEPLKAWAKWLQEAIAIKVGPSDGNDEDAFQARGISTFRGAPRHSAHLPTDQPDGIDSNKLALMKRFTIQAASSAARAMADPLLPWP